MTYNDKTKKLIILLVFVISGFCAKSQATLTGPYINFPDSNFFKALLKVGVDLNIDGKIDTIEAQKITILNIFNSNISDLKGIEYFKNILILDCSNNLLSTIDVTKNIKLTDLRFHANLLTSIDISKNINLDFLSCGGNKLLNLDITKNINLTILDCYANNLINLDLSKNFKLINLDCSVNNISTLDLSKNTALHVLNLTYMPKLSTICVWTLPFPPYYTDPYFVFYNDSTPNIKFQLCNNFVEEKPSENFTFYPNPIKDRIFINADVDDKIKEINVYTIFGSLVATVTPNNDNSIDVSNLKQGVYIIELRTENNVLRQKFIKE